MIDLVYYSLNQPDNKEHLVKNEKNHNYKIVFALSISVEEQVNYCHSEK